uniref:Uncharacterized protein n=1 Tax=Glossina austeni TaxID=7395 RepID=A0A1A9UJR8_GLOAU
MNQQNYIKIIALLSSSASIISLVAFSTNYWLKATAILSERLESRINYGLFAGTLERHQLASTLKFDLKIVCNLDLKACMFSCQRDHLKRERELKRVYNKQKLESCEQNLPSAPKTFRMHFENSTQGKSNNTDSNNKKIKKSYISAPLWLVTVLFFSIAQLFSFVSMICALINIKWHPIEPIFNIYGLYIWNTVVVVCLFGTLVFWYALYSNHLIYNVAITDTLRQELNFISDGYARLGYSFYLLLILILLHVVILILLCFRAHHIDAHERTFHSRRNMNIIDDGDGRFEFY